MSVIHKRTALLCAALSLCCFNVNVYAEIVTPPQISNNVVIKRNTTPAQCPKSWTGQADPAIMTADTQYGTDTGVDLVGVQSCTGCAIDPKTNNCVCKTCYGLYN